MSIWLEKRPLEAQDFNGDPGASRTEGSTRQPKNAHWRRKTLMVTRARVERTTSSLGRNCSIHWATGPNRV